MHQILLICYHVTFPTTQQPNTLREAGTNVPASSHVRPNTMHARMWYMTPLAIRIKLCPGSLILPSDRQPRHPHSTKPPQRPSQLSMRHHPIHRLRPKRAIRSTTQGSLPAAQEPVYLQKQQHTRHQRFPRHNPWRRPRASRTNIKRSRHNQRITRKTLDKYSSRLVTLSSRSAHQQRRH